MSRILIHDHSNIHQGGKLRNAYALEGGMSTGGGSGGGGIGLPVMALDDLTDVVITSATLADRLRFDGTNWVNSALIWRSMTAFDPTTGNWLPLVDGSGNQLIAEA